MTGRDCPAARYVVGEGTARPGGALSTRTVAVKTENAEVWGVAALSERPVGEHSTAEVLWCTTALPDVSLPGPEGAVAISQYTVG